MEPQTGMDTFTRKHKDAGTEDRNFGQFSVWTNMTGKDKQNQLNMGFKANNWKTASPGSRAEVGNVKRCKTRS